MQIAVLNLMGNAMDVKITNMVRGASTTVQLTALHVIKTQAALLVRLDAGASRVSHCAANDVRTRNVNRMMGYVYPVQLVFMERCVTRNVQDIVLESCAINLLMLQFAL